MKARCRYFESTQPELPSKHAHYEIEFQSLKLRLNFRVVVPAVTTTQIPTKKENQSYSLNFVVLECQLAAYSFEILSTLGRAILRPVGHGDFAARARVSLNHQLVRADRLH
jgi:hypothetical protein